ncbi:MAG: uroporphyrinogen-III synthase [Methanobacteriaceae archaeon]|nr:uroporphyrinogen-III synthase [Methanobacteriaceae archaeon]
MDTKKIIAITRPKDRSKNAMEFIQEYGGESYVVPTLELTLTNTDSLKQLMKDANQLDWLIFTSVTSIEAIFKFYPDFLDKLNPNCKIATIGHKTAELAIEKELPVDLMPKDYTAEGLLEEFEKIDLNNKIIGVPRTFSARTILPEGLEEMGAKVILAESYKSTIPQDTSKIKELIKKINNKEIDGITFTSPLTVENLFITAKDKKEQKLLAKNLSENTLTVSIGPITGKILDKYNVKYIMPKRYTVKDMIDLMFKTFNEN